MSFDLFTRIQEFNSRGIHYDFPPSGELLVAVTKTLENDHPLPPFDVSKGQHCYDWPMKVKKPGDVGIDIPVRIKGMENVRTGDGRPVLQLSPEPPIHNYLVNYVDGWVDIPPGTYAELPSALHIKLPDDAWGMIRPRSSTGWKRRLSVFEGTIDSAFTGQLCCLVHNPSSITVRIMHNDALAQLVVVPKYPLERVVIVDHDDLPKTDRGQTGFGSTGR